eukprot:3023487-Pyramimonas_sp.AAC.1
MSCLRTGRLHSAMLEPADALVYWPRPHLKCIQCCTEASTWRGTPRASCRSSAPTVSTAGSWEDAPETSSRRP